MNSLEMFATVQMHLDTAKNPRYNDWTMVKAINSAIVRVVEDRIDNIKTPTGYSFEQVQRVTDELRSLVPNPVTIIPTNTNQLVLPADYRHALLVNATVSGVTAYAKPIDHLTLGTIDRNPFTRPKADNYKFYQENTHINVLYGTGTFTTADLTYIKNPNTVSIGRENDKLTGGLTVGVIYAVYEDCEHNGVVYNTGDLFTAVNANLAYGIVVPNSVLVNSDVPTILHEEICLVTCSILNNSVDDYNKKQSTDQDIMKD